MRFVVSVNACLEVGPVMSAPCVARHALLERLGSEPSGWGREARIGALGDLERLRGWLDSREAAVLAVCHSERDDVNSGARDITQLVQQQSNVSYGTAKRRALRASSLTTLPAATAALVTGELGRTDELCALAERLPPELRPVLAAAEKDLVTELAGLTPVQARKHLLAFEADITPDDGTTTEAESVAVREEPRWHHQPVRPTRPALGRLPPHLCRPQGHRTMAPTRPRPRCSRPAG